MSEMNVTRRNFLSGAALVSAAIAGAGLAGCAPQSAAPAASSSSAGETLGTTGAARARCPGSARRPQSATIRWKKS